MSKSHPYKAATHICCLSESPTNINNPINLIASVRQKSFQIKIPATNLASYNSESPIVDRTTSRSRSHSNRMRTPPPPSSTTKTPCCTKVGLKRGPWTPEEDDLLSNFITREGEGKWRTLPKSAGLLRCGKSCRLRWMNYLRPSVKRGHIAPDEEDLILRLHRLLGNRWSLIAGRIPGRTDNEIKNYWNTHLSKKLISQGIDPRTHKPLSDVQPPNHNPVMVSNYESNINGVGVAEPPVYDEFGNPDANRGLNFNEMESPSLEEDDPNYCNDEVFSSFLNSLINEDIFTQSALGAPPDHDHPH